MKHFLLYLSLFLLVCCNRLTNNESSENNNLPSISQIGNNTFGVKINGSIFTPKSSKNDLSDILYPTYKGIILLFFDNKKNLTTSANFDKTSLTSLDIFINDPETIKVKTYTLNGQDQSNIPGRVTIDYLVYESVTIKKEYKTIPNSGSINITRNDDNVISGTFSGKLKNTSDPNDVVEVTEGRFDFNKNTINDYKFP